MREALVVSGHSGYLCRLMAINNLVLFLWALQVYSWRAMSLCSLVLSDRTVPDCLEVNFVFQIEPSRRLGRQTSSAVLTSDCLPSASPDGGCFSFTAHTAVPGHFLLSAPSTRNQREAIHVCRPLCRSSANPASQLIEHSGPTATSVLLGTSHISTSGYVM